MLLIYCQIAVDDDVDYDSSDGKPSASETSDSEPTPRGPMQTNT